MLSSLQEESGISFGPVLFISRDCPKSHLPEYRRTASFSVLGSQLKPFSHKRGQIVAAVGYYNSNEQQVVCSQFPHLPFQPALSSTEPRLSYLSGPYSCCFLSLASLPHTQLC